MAFSMRIFLTVIASYLLLLTLLILSGCKTVSQDPADGESSKDDLDTAHALVGAAQNTVGNLEKPNSGLLFIAPLVEIYGLNKEDRQ